jgi:hypothetical protein
VFGLDEAFSHGLSIDLLAITCRLVSSWFPAWRIADNLDAVRRARAGDMILFDPSVWMRGQCHLRQSWTVTSDSIAAELAAQLAADELVLLKSALPGDGSSLQEMSERGYLDGAIVAIAERLKDIRIVNLAQPDTPELRLGIDPHTNVRHATRRMPQ